MLLAILLAARGAQARPHAPRRRADASRSRAASVTLDVEAIGARAAGATDAMRARVRDHVAHHLRVLTEARLLASPRGYVVDGSIEALAVVDRPDGVEISGVVRLILSARASGAMLAMSTGQATLRQAAPKNGGRPLPAAQAERFELEVLDGAVRAASDELVQHFELRRKS